MPFSGGTYSAPSLPGSWNPAIEGQDATATDWNTLLTDLSTALSTCITRNGQSTITANIPMSGFVFTGLGAGAANGQSVRYEQAAIQGYIGGLTLSNNSGSPNTKIDVSAGMAADSTNASVIRVSAVTLDCGTTGANGLDTGSLANSTWYHAYAIGKTDGTGATLASTSATSPTMPSGYTLKRRIGSFLTDGSAHIIAFTQVGDDFIWAAGVTDFNTTVTTTVAQNVTCTVPTGVIVKALVSVSLANSGITGTISALYAYPSVLTSGVASVAQGGTSGTANTAAVCAAMVNVTTTSSAQIKIRADGDNTLTVTLVTLGWTDTRGRFA